MFTNPYNTYQRINKEQMSSRELEASILNKAGAMLKRCQEHWNDTDRDARLDDALKFNQKIWSFFQAELIDPENPLPMELKCSILNLSLFIDKSIYDIMAYPEADKLTPIIDINLNLAAGLFARVDDTDVEKAA